MCDIRYCQDCVCLIENDDQEAECDELGKRIGDVDFLKECPEYPAERKIELIRKMAKE